MRLFVLLALLIAMIFCIDQPLKGEPGVKLSSEVESVLGSMPPNVQTIAVTSLSKNDLADGDVALLKPDFGEWQIHLLRPLWLLADINVEDGTPRVCIDCVVSGTVEGVVPPVNKSCQFLFVDESPSFLDSFDKLLADANHYNDIGFSVAELKYRKSDDLVNLPPRYYVCRVRPGIVLGATDKALLHEVLRRIQDGGGTGSARALPDDLDEWSCVDTGAPFWAIRHFSRGDSTAPTLRKNGKKPFDDKGIGMTFSYRPQQHLLVLNYLSKSSNLTRLARAVFGIDERNAAQLKFLQKTLKPHVTSIEVKTLDEQFPHFFFHRLAFWLGD